MKLYELGASMVALQARLEEVEDPSEAQLTQWEDNLRDLEGKFDEKIENCAKVIKSLQADVDAIATERTRLQGRKSTLENRIEWLKGYVFGEMNNATATKVKGAIVSVSIKKSPPSCGVIDEEKLPAGFWTAPVAEPMRGKIIEYFRATGEVPDGVEIITDRESLSIR